MNDPFECLVYSKREFSFNECEKFRTCFPDQSVKSFSDKEVNQEISMLREVCIKKYAFSSFSTEPDNILMWSHYANNHHGFVVKYEIDDEITSHHLQKIEYCDSLPKLDIEKISLYENGVPSNENVNYILSDISRKARVWEYEKEYRIWNDGEGYYNPEHLKIKEIIFGFKSEEYLLNTVISILSEYLNEESEDLRLSIMKFQSTPLGLHAVDLNKDITLIHPKNRAPNQFI